MYVVRICALLAVAFGLLRPAPGWSENSQYQRMAPLHQYLATNRQAEIDLARSAAPAAISLHATILVLTPRGYEAAHKGTDGFTCLVERSWTAPFDDSEFWNAKMRGPICYNPVASRTILQYTLFRTQMALAGVTRAEMLARLKTAIADKRLPALEPGSMAYMLSKEQYLNDAAKSWYPHLMIYVPKADGANAGASWGANQPGSPVAYDSSHRIVPEPWAVFYAIVSHWSDGSPAPK